MMKIFNQTVDFTDKVNFIDDQGIMLGYDLEQDCCETAEWDIPDLNLNTEASKGITEIPYRFDDEFIEKTEDRREEQYIAKFRLLPDDRANKPDLARSGNHHNGYYSP